MAPYKLAAGSMREMYAPTESALALVRRTSKLWPYAFISFQSQASPNMPNHGAR